MSDDWGIHTESRQGVLTHDDQSTLARHTLSIKTQEHENARTSFPRKVSERKQRSGERQTPWSKQRCSSHQAPTVWGNAVVFANLDLAPLHIFNPSQAAGSSAPAKRCNVCKLCFQSAQSVPPLPHAPLAAVAPPRRQRRRHRNSAPRLGHTPASTFQLRSKPTRHKEFCKF